jgi:hypothetical protein
MPLKTAGPCKTYPDIARIARFDGITYNSHPTIIVSAGNNGLYHQYDQDGTYKIYDIATAYNINTGSYDDKNNNDSGDDVMSNFSSYVDPTSYNGDRENRMWSRREATSEHQVTPRHYMKSVAQALL